MSNRRLGSSRMWRPTYESTNCDKISYRERDLLLLTGDFKMTGFECLVLLVLVHSLQPRHLFVHSFQSRHRHSIVMTLHMHVGPGLESFVRKTSFVFIVAILR